MSNSDCLTGMDGSMKVTIGIAKTLEDIRADALSDLDFLCLTEMFNCSYTPEVVEELRDTEEVIHELTNLSGNYPGLYLVGGTLPIIREQGEKPQNRSFTFRNGEIVHGIAKINMFRPINDQQHFSPGSYVPPFNADIRGEVVRTGVLICYDLRFPEIARQMAKDDLDVLFVPAFWPAKRDLPWRTLLAARAIENHIFTVGVNGDGKSYCFSPTGDCHYESDGVIDFASFEINLDEIAEVKKFINTLE
jgi:predicted amidohydrolase